MISKRVLRSVLWTAPVAALAFACASPVGDDVVLGTRDDAPSFTPADAGAAETASPNPLIALCIETECPAPFGTCAASTFKCDVDLFTDDDNCGACGNVCPNHAPIHMPMHCRDGICVGSCEGNRKDCNGVIDDGCEAVLKEDPNNCGACGVKCGEGIPCLEGQCGCTPPKVLCDGVCTDITKDARSCGACNHVCSRPPGDPPPPPNMGYGCTASTCGLGCNQFFADCDNDFPTLGFASNGCEVDITTKDNCGACGVKCAPEQECGKDPQDNVFCYSPTCPPGTTACANGCVNLLTAPYDCGGCGIVCPGETRQNAPTHAQAVCRTGECSIVCEASWADCDGNIANGCETDLSRDPANCGACGLSCDSSAGQPCVRGVCLTKPCEEGEEPVQ